MYIQVVSGEIGRRNGELNEGIILNLILDLRTNCWIFNMGSKPILLTIFFFNKIVILFGGMIYKVYICTNK